MAGLFIMPLVFRTVKYNNYIPPRHETTHVESHDTRPVIFANERVGDFSLSDTNLVNFMASVLVNAEKELCKHYPLFVAVYDVPLGERITVNTDVQILFYNSSANSYTDAPLSEQVATVKRFSIYEDEHAKCIESYPYVSSGVYCPSYDVQTYLNPNMDNFVACHILFNKNTGQSSHGVYFASVFNFDYYYNSRGKLHVQPDSTVYGRFEKFAELMALVVPLSNGFYLDQYGVMCQGEKHTGKIVLTGISDMRMLRRKELETTKAEHNFRKCFISSVSNYVKVMAYEEFLTTLTNHNFYDNLFRDHTKTSTYYAVSGLWKFLKNSLTECVSEKLSFSKEESGPYLFLNPACGLRKTPNNARIIELVELYKSFWESQLKPPVFNYRYGFSVHYDGNIQDPKANVNLLDAARFRQYIDPDSLVNKIIWREEVKDKLDLLLTNADRHITQHENVVRFAKIYALVEKFFVSRSPYKITVSSVNYLEEFWQHHRCDWIQEAGKGDNRYKDEYKKRNLLVTTQNYYTSSGQNRPFFYHMNAAGFCPMPIDTFVPDAKEAKAHIFTGERVERPGRVCEQDLKFQTGLIGGGKVTVKVQDALKNVRETIGGVYHHGNCASEKVGEKSGVLQGGFLIGGKAPSPKE